MLFSAARSTSGHRWMPFGTMKNECLMWVGQSSINSWGKLIWIIKTVCQTVIIPNDFLKYF